MERDGASFGADIKKYEDTLAKDPGSYCFAPLAELYRKQGLLDDAITVAQRGCDIHPDYVGGYMALGRAFWEKGMKDESRAALEKVVGITPDNLLAQKLLSQIYVEQGNVTAARKALRLVLSQSPEDMESQALLDSLKDPSALEFQSDPDMEGEDNRNIASSMKEEDVALEDLEEADIIEELTDEDLFEENEFVVSPVKAETPLQEDAIFSEGKNPVSTITLAELYVTQGFVKRALTIYRELLEADPGNADVKNRLYELKKTIDDDTVTARNNLLAADEAVTEVAGTSGDDGVSPPEMAMTVSEVAEGSVIETLEKWLDTIRRRR
jgi:tetratricopeptide (TPR) repeat protein